MLFQCWPTVCDAGPTLKQHCFILSCLLGGRHQGGGGGEGGVGRTPFLLEITLSDMYCLYSPFQKNWWRVSYPLYSRYCNHVQNAKGLCVLDADTHADADSDAQSDAQSDADESSHVPKFPRSDKNDNVPLLVCQVTIFSWTLLFKK